MTNPSKLLTTLLHSTLALVIALLGINFSALPVLAATLALSPASGTFAPGCNFTVKVELNTTGTQTDGTDAVINYDPSKLEPQEPIVSGTIYPEYPGNFIDITAKKINISGLASVTDAYSGSGTLATINLKVLPGASEGVTKLSFDFDPNNKTNTTDSNVVERGTVVDVLNTVTDGTYTIKKGAPCTGGQGGPVATASAKPVGGPIIASPSATPFVSQCINGVDANGNCKQAGIFETTMILTAVGGILTIIGIVGLAVL